MSTPTTNLTLRLNGQLDVTGLTGILRSSNPTHEVGRLFKHDAVKRKKTCPPSENNAGQRGIKHVLNALQNYDHALTRVFSDRTQIPASLFAHRHSTRRGRAVNIESHTYTYKADSGLLFADGK